MRREGVSYLKLALGSLQHGLSPEERMRLHFVVLLAHINQTEHPDHNEPWLTGMADQLAAYQDDEERLELAETMESQPHAVKSKFDYSIVMEECAKTEAPYMLIMEDDVVFLDGWRHRTINALNNAMAKSWEAGHTHCKFVCWPGSTNGVGLDLLTKVKLGSSIPSSFLLRRPPGLELGRMANVPCVIPCCCRNCVQRSGLNTATCGTPMANSNCHLNHYFCIHTHSYHSILSRRTELRTTQPSGVHVMDKYACCGQGLVFPRTIVTKDLLPWFRNNKWSPISTDSFIEEYAETTGALRWALTPVVMQHIGGQSSHNGRRGDTYEPSRLWNFGFEGNDAAQLAEEHAQAQYNLLEDLDLESIT